MNSDKSDTTKLDRSGSMGLAAWCVAALLALSLIGLVHDPENATAANEIAAEAGRGVEIQENFQHDVMAAKRHRIWGFAGLLSIGLYCAVTAPRNARFQLDVLSLLIAAGLLWTLASVAWSVDRMITLREFARLFGYLFAAAALARRFDPRRLCLVLTFAMLGSVAAAVGVEIVTGGFRPWIPAYRLTGSLHSNGLAMQAMLVALAAYAFARDSRRPICWWTLFLTMIAVVLLTKTRSCVVTGAVGVMAIHLVGRPARNWLHFALCAATLLAAILLAANALGIWDTRYVQNLATLGRGEDVASLTGRIPLWEFIWQETAGRRLEGFGYGAFWLTERTLSARDTLGWFPRHAHSGYLETIVNVGLVGLAIVMAVGFLALRRAAWLVERTGRPEFYAMVAFLVAAFVNSISEPSFVMPRDMALFNAAAVFSLVVMQTVAGAHRASVVGNGTGNLPATLPLIASHPSVHKPQL